MSQDQKQVGEGVGVEAEALELPAVLQNPPWLAQEGRLLVGQ